MSYDTAKELNIGPLLEKIIFFKTHIGLWKIRHVLSERGGGGRSKIQNYILTMIPIILKMNISAYGGKGQNVNGAHLWEA